MKFKRIVALVLVVLMVLGTLGGAVATLFADEVQGDGGEKLFEYGFIQGGTDGDLMLDQNIKRREVVVILANIYGLSEEAANYIFTPVFSDVKSDDWFAPYVCFAKSMGWVSGDAEGTYRPDDNVTEQEWATILLTALDYKVNWTSVVDDAKDIDIDIYSQNSSALTRGEAFDSLWDAVKIPKSGETVALGVELGKIPAEDLDPTVIEDDEEDDVVVVVPTEDFEVKDVEADNLKEIIVIYTDDVDSITGTDLDNYTLEDSDDGDDVDIESIDLIDDDTVRITLEDVIKKQTEVDLKIKDVESSTGEELYDDFEDSFIINDITPPTIEDVTMVAEKAILIEFSEPMVDDEYEDDDSDSDDDKELVDKNAFDVIVDDSKISIKSSIFSDDNRSVIVNLYSDIEDADQVDIEVSDRIEDFSGFKIDNDTYTFDVEADDTEPYIVDYKNPTISQITLVWSEDIYIEDNNDNNYYHTNSKNRIDSNLSSSSIDGNELTLYFSDSTMPEGEVTITVVEDSITDLWGNVNNDEDFDVIIPEDETDPEIDSDVEYVKEDEIELTVSELLNNEDDDVTDVDNYYLEDSSGDDVTDMIDDIDYDSSDLTITISFDEDLLGEYELTISDLEDMSGNEISKTRIDLEVFDLTPPDSSTWTAKVYDAGKSYQMLIVDFGEPMATSGKYSIIDLENYKVSGYSLAELYDEDEDLVEIDLIDNDSAIEISIAPEDDGGFDLSYDSNTSLDEDDDLVTTRLADADGNYTSDYENVVDLSGAGYISIDSVELIGDTEIAVTFSDELVGIEEDDLVFKEDGDELQIISYDSDLTEDESTIIIYEFDESLPDDADGLKVYIEDNDSSNRYGESLDLDDGPFTVEDKLAPSLALKTIDGDNEDYVVYDESSGIITIKFSEDIDEDMISKATFEVEDYEIDSINVTGQYVKITIDEDDRDSVDVNDDIELTHSIADESGNMLEDLAIEIHEID